MIFGFGIAIWNSVPLIFEAQVFKSISKHLKILAACSDVDNAQFTTGDVHQCKKGGKNEHETCGFEWKGSERES